MSDTEKPIIDLENYTPALLSNIANKLASGASQHYLKLFGVGVEIWRCLVLLAIDDEISAQYISNTIGQDKSAVSRSFKYMHDEGLISFNSDPKDGRLRLATLTDKGRNLHNQILKLAMVRQAAFLAPLNKKEQVTLNKLLWRLNEKLPNVELAALEYAKSIKV